MLTFRRSIIFLYLAAFSAASMDSRVYASRSVEQGSHNTVGRETEEHDDVDIHSEDENHLESSNSTEDHDDHDEDEFHDEVPEVHSGDKPWAEVIVASLLINLATLAGLVVLSGQFLAQIFCKSRVGDTASSSRWNQNIIPSFACGALLATVAFLILPESLAMLKSHFEGESGAHRALEEEDHEEHEEEEGHEEEEESAEGAIAWRFGASLLGGFLLPIFSSFLFPKNHEPDFCDACIEDKNEENLEQTNLEVANAVKMGSKIDSPAELEVKDDDPSSSKDPITAGEGCESAGRDHGEHRCNDEESVASASELSVTLEKKQLTYSTQINYSLASSILLGDFFHNFTDGVLVGTAFSLCERDLAIAISVATVYHELAQEIADFFLLTQHCNIRPAVALLLNFVGGLSVLFGAILVLSADVTANATGCILAVGSGVYMYVAVGECLPRAQKAQKTANDKVISVASFVLGVIPIGLVLLNHGHCEAGH